MAVLTLPTNIGFVTWNLRLVANTLPHRSPMVKSVQTVEFPGQTWALELVLPPLRQDLAAPWQVFLTELDGMAGRFYGYDPDKTTPRGTAAGTPVVDGPDQTGKILNTKGWAPSAPGVLLQADQFALDLPSGGRSLHMVLKDVNADAGGLAQIEIRPPLRESPANAAMLIKNTPSCIMQLIDDEQANWTFDRERFYQIAFAAREAFDLG